MPVIMISIQNRTSQCVECNHKKKEVLGRGDISSKPYFTWLENCETNQAVFSPVNAMSGKVIYRDSNATFEERKKNNPLIEKNRRCGL
jgi:hypothetical protein